MRTTDLYDLRKEAARLFVDLARDDDQIAVVDFDSSAHLRASLCDVGDNRASLKSAINQIDSSGNTNIGSGLNAGYNQLNRGNALASHTKSAILLSDGQSSYPSSAVSSYVSKGWPIYTIAHSDAADEELMNNIAQATGGEYYKTKEAWNLLELYLGIYSQNLRFNVADIYQIHRQKQTISARESIEGVLTMDSSIDFTELVLFSRESDSGSRSSSMESLDIISENESENGLDYIEDNDLASEKENSKEMTRSQEDLSLVLYYPNGTEVSLNSSSSTGTDDPDIIHISSDYYEIYKINKQLPGNWTYNMTSGCNSTQEYALFVNTNTSIEFESALDKTEYSTGEQVRINASLFNGTQGFENASVTAYMTLPDQTTCNIRLNDMGNGSYGKTLGYVMQEGTYEILVEAVKDDIIRQEYLEFEAFEPSWVNFTADVRLGIAPSTVNFTDLSTGATVWEWDIDGDGVTGYVTQNVSHTYDSPGVYNVSLTVGNGTSYGTETKLFYLEIFDPEDLVNGGFETGDIYGWTVDTGHSSPEYYHKSEVAKEHNYSGSYGCELNVSSFSYGHSFISLTQAVNLTDIEAVAFSHRQTYSQDIGSGYIQLEFYVDDNMTVIPFSNNSWIQESVDVSGYSGDHNITLRLYSMCPGLMTGHQSTVEIDDISLVPTPDDWNPWNDADSDGGALITTPELQEVVITGLMTSHPANHRPPAGVPLHQSPFHKSTQTAPFQVIMSHLTALLL